MSNWIGILLLFIGMSGQAQTIDSIHFQGLTTTDPAFLRSLITSKEGFPFDSLAFEDDLRQLRCLNLFFDVQGTVERNASKTILHIHIRESQYLYPIVGFGAFLGQVRLKLGVNHINFRGRGQSLGAIYQWYDRHSLAVFHTVPRHLRGKTGHETAVSRYATIEPLYFQDTVSIFNFTNYTLSGGGFYWLKRYLNLAFGGAVMYEDYLQRDSAYSLGANRFAFVKHQFRSSTNLDRVEGIYERRSGINFQAYGEWIHTYGIHTKDASFIKFTTHLQSYHLVGKRGNLAFRSRIGIASNRFSPFSPFVLDGFLNVRGIGDRVERGTGEVISTVEYRHSCWRNPYFTVQAVAFSDFGALRPAGKTFRSVIENRTAHLFGGIGVRIHLNVLYKTAFRFDYSFPIYSMQNSSSMMRGGLSFGIGQFF